MNQTIKPYDLEDRTANFGEQVILLCKKVTPDIVTRSLISQLIRSSTSVGANYVEANGASSKKDFRNLFVLITKNETPATAAETSYLDLVRTSWEAFFHKSTGQTATINTSLK